MWEFKSQAAFVSCDFSAAEELPLDDPSNSISGDESVTRTYGTPALVIAEGSPFAGSSVRFYGGAPSEYCQAGQKFTVVGDGPGSNAPIRVGNWGKPGEWNPAGFLASANPDQQLIFDFPLFAPAPIAVSAQAAP